MITRQNEENILKQLSPEEESTIVGGGYGYGYGGHRGGWGRRWRGWRGGRRWWRGGHHRRGYDYDRYYH